MRPRHLVLVLLAAISTYICLAQIIDRIDFGTLPACANQCGALSIIAGKCAPTATDTITPTPFDRCVCASEVNQRLFFIGNFCARECSSSENARIKQYFQMLCARHGLPLTTPFNAATSAVSVTPYAGLPATMPSAEVATGISSQSPARLPAETTAQPTTEPPPLAKPSTELSASVAANKHISSKYWAIASILVALFLLLAAWAIFKRYRQQPKLEGIKRTIDLDVVSSPSAAHLRGENQSAWPVYSFSMNHLNANNPYGASMASPVERPM